MLYRNFGPHAHVPVVGQGTWRIEKSDHRSAISAIRHGLDLGMTHIDTAERYAFGFVEEMVAEAIDGRRDEIFLVSKVLPENATSAGMKLSCEASLRRLRTDRLDCYLLHWRGQVPLEQSVAGFEALKQEGKIVSWGVSNFDVHDLDEMISLTDVQNITCNQIFYHLLERGSEHTAIPWCRKHGVAVTAYSSFGNGAFPLADSPAGHAASEIARARGISVHQLILAFLIQESEVFLIPRSANPTHTEENGLSAEIELSGEEIAKLKAAFPQGSRPDELPSI